MGAPLSLLLLRGRPKMDATSAVSGALSGPKNAWSRARTMPNTLRVLVVRALLPVPMPTGPVVVVVVVVVAESSSGPGAWMAVHGRRGKLVEERGQ